MKAIFLFLIKFNPSYTVYHTNLSRRESILSTPTNHVWKPTFAKKMVFIHGYGFPLKVYRFSLQGDGFPLHGDFWQN